MLKLNTSLDKLPYNQVIDKYINICNMFSLSTPYGKDCYLREEDSIKVLDEYYKYIIQVSRSLWDEMTEYEKEGLPSFEHYLEEMVAERNKGTLFNFALFSETNKRTFTNNEPFELYEIKQLQALFAETADHHKKLSKNKQTNLFEIFRCSENEPLLKNLLHKRITHITYCTVSGNLQIIYYFKCNTQTAEWLKRKKDIFDFNGLEDLAFFKDGKCILSSCTHERYISITEE